MWNVVTTKNEHMIFKNYMPFSFTSETKNSTKTANIFKNKYRLNQILTTRPTLVSGRARGLTSPGMSSYSSALDARLCGS